jgi:hypothetical protein
VCHAVRALGSKVTRATDRRDGLEAESTISTRTEPVKYLGSPFVDRSELLRDTVTLCASNEKERRTLTSVLNSVSSFLIPQSHDHSPEASALNLRLPETARVRFPDPVEFLPDPV